MVTLALVLSRDTGHGMQCVSQWVYGKVWSIKQVIVRGETPWISWSRGKILSGIRGAVLLH